MTYPMAPMAGGPGPGPGTYPPQPPWTPPPPPRRGTTARLGLAAVILAAGLVGGIIGSLITQHSSTSETPTSTTAAQDVTPDDVRAQDIKLCTEYVLINETRPQPVTSSRDLVPVIAAVRTSLATYPDASADLRSALNDVVDAYFAELSDFESKGAKGLVDPPKYNEAAAQATHDRAWALCGLR